MTEFRSNLYSDFPTDHTEGTVSTQVIELAELIKEKGRRSTQELPPLLKLAKCLAEDSTLNDVSRALAHRAAANAHQLMNEFEPALNSYDRATSILEGIDEPVELGRTLHAKVGLLNFMCRFDELLVCADRARSIFETLNDRHRLARLDANLSHAYQRLNRFDLVLHFAERAMPALEEAGDREGYFATLSNSAAALMLMNDFEEAERRYARALGIAETMGWSVWSLACRYNIAYLLYLRGNSAEALREIDALRSTYEERGDRRQVCQCCLNEAEILIEIGDFKGAIEVAGRAEVLARSLGLSLETGKALVFQAVAARRLNTREIGPLLAEATRCFQEERNDAWTAIAKLQVALIGGEWGDVHGLEEALAARALLQNSGLPNRLALADIIIGRIRKTRGDVEGALEAFRCAHGEADRGRSEWMQFHAANELGTLLVRTQPSEALHYLRGAEKRLDSLWDRLGSDDLKLAFLNDRENVYTQLVRLAVRQSPESALELSEKARSRVLCERLGTGPMNASALTASLSADETVLEYFIDGTDLLIFTITQTGVRCVRQENAVPEVETLLANFERHVKSSSVNWEHLARAHKHHLLTASTRLNELYRILIEPIAPELRKRIIVVPQGLLHRVPFHALRNSGGYLIDEHDVAYTPSAALYCNPVRVSGSNSAVLVAFSGSQKTTAEDEVREAASKLADALVLVDPPISRLIDVFKTPHALVHIAGHAGIDSIGGRLAWIETTEGRLTTRDLSDLAIRANTIVITGCQTARRSIRPGDEWQGLMRSFYLAGAGAVVSALWDIRDESARRFSSSFYDNFEGGDVVTAVQTAMKTVRSWRQHPYFWAGFSTFIRNQQKEDM